MQPPGDVQVQAPVRKSGFDAQLSVTVSFETGSISEGPLFVMVRVYVRPTPAVAVALETVFTIEKSDERTIVGVAVEVSVVGLTPVFAVAVIVAVFDNDMTDGATFQGVLSVLLWTPMKPIHTFPDI